MIYLLEDDDSIRKLVVYALQSQGMDAEGFEVPSAFWQAMKKEIPSLVILDIMLPEEDGLTILQKLRLSPVTKHLPIIMLTAKATEYDRVLGLDGGADDYISKPFGMMEMIARVKAVLRRSAFQESAAAEPDVRPDSYQRGKLSVCPARHEASVDGEKILLTYKEFQLLELFVENEGIVLTREVLMDKVWGLENERENRTLDVHIRTLRTKLKDAGDAIETVRGVGYRLNGEAL